MRICLVLGSYSASVIGLLWRVLCGALSAGLECGWYPGAAAEKGAEGVEFAVAPSGGGGQVGLDDGEVGEAVEGAPASAGAALLDFDGPDGALGFVVGEDVQVGAGGEAEDHVLVLFEAAGQGAGGAAVRAVVPVPVDGASLGGDGVVAGDEP